MAPEHTDPLSGVDVNKLAMVLYEHFSSGDRKRYLVGRIEVAWTELARAALAEVRRQLSEREGNGV